MGRRRRGEPTDKMREPGDFEPRRPSATFFAAKVGLKASQEAGQKKRCPWAKQTAVLSFFEDLYNEIIRRKDRRDFPRNEMSLGEKAQDHGSKGNGGGENRVPS